MTTPDGTIVFIMLNIFSEGWYLSVTSGERTLYEARGSIIRWSGNTGELIQDRGGALVTARGEVVQGGTSGTVELINRRTIDLTFRGGHTHRLTR